MNIFVNGEQSCVAKSTSITDLIVSFGLLPEATAVQCNGEIVPRSEYASTTIKEGDVIELVRFVGGG